ncbi:hypothetical protein HYH02_012320 [Chlamydomonas schloesseri]|uniref:RING-type domain-containing protein n=1 Tax=Chlamydomonas schloesseri TaxID=2026947 RepID=A0A835T614_9CHLO|nr:hypothetical protein HYH02_012320 [Chlamydomonas schloesseri]|eukprot:KAG2434494.1 hypothetical protein HYH02_012320 [Chlamydomonas schloesseri]
MTPIHLAAWAGRSHVVAYLCAWSSEHATPRRSLVNVPCGLGAQLPPLAFACARRHAEVVAVLLRHGASITLRGHCVCLGTRLPHPGLAQYGLPPAAGTHATALHIASAVHDNSAVVKLLLGYYLENVLVRARAPMYDPRLQRNGESQRALELQGSASLAAAAAAAARRRQRPAQPSAPSAAAYSSSLPSAAPSSRVAATAAGAAGLPEQQQPQLQVSVAALLDPNTLLQDALPEVARAATSLVGHRTLTNGNVPTLQQLAAAALAGRLSKSVEAASAGGVQVPVCCLPAKVAGSVAPLPRCESPTLPGSASCSRSISGRSSAGGSSCASPCGSSCSNVSSSRTSSSGGNASMDGRESSRRPLVPGGSGDAESEEQCCICMAEVCTVRSSNCTHGVCAGCAKQLCKQVSAKLAPLRCPFCRDVVKSFVLC